MFLLDTNVVSEMRKIKKGRADPNVVRWVDRVDVAFMFLSVITVMELETGILQLQRRDGPQAARLRAWLDNQILPGFADRLLPVDLAVAQRCAPLHVPDPRADRDALIAATALVHGMTVATRNTADFAATGASILNPWTPV